MKYVKFLLYIIISLSFFSVCTAEDYWTKLNFDEEVRNIFYTSQGEIYITSIDSVNVWNVFVSKDFGNSWDSIPRPTIYDYIYLRYIDETGNNLVVEFQSDLYIANKDTLIWDSLGATAWSVQDKIYNHNNYLYSLHWGGISKSNEDWTDWTKVLDTSLNEQFNALVVDSSGTIFAGSINRLYGTESGIYRSFDDGITWELYPQKQGIMAMDIDSYNMIFAADYYEILRSTDNGDSWQNMLTFSSSGYPKCIHVNAADEVYIGISADFGFGGMAISEDHGVTWEVINEGFITSGDLHTGSIYDIAESPDGYLYLATSGGVYRSLRSTTEITGSFITVNKINYSSDIYSSNGLIDVELKNVGVNNSVDINLTATTNSPYINLNDSTEYFGNILIGDSLQIEDCLSYTISPNLPDGTVARISLTITDSTDQYFYGHVDLIIKSPEFEYDYGLSGTGIIYPGQNKDLIINVKNTGSVVIDNVHTNISEIGSDYLTLFQYGDISSLLPGDSADIEYSLEFPAEIPNGTLINLKFESYADNGFESSYDIPLRIGIIDDFETGDFTKNEWYFEGDADWVIDSLVSYDGNYSMRSGGIISGETSTAVLELDFIENGSISFEIKLNTMNSSYNILNFYVNDYLIQSWGGDEDWSSYYYPALHYPAMSGHYIFRWEYSKEKDRTGDCVWVDNIVATGIETGIFEDMNIVSDLILKQNYPNPFNNETTISFEIPEISEVELSVYNIKGEFLQNICKRKLNKGQHQFTFNAEYLNSGVYLYKLKLNGKTAETKKMIYLK